MEAPTSLGLGFVCVCVGGGGGGLLHFYTLYMG